MRVAVIGGGVSGLAIGWRLAAAGCAVDVFERDRAGRGASWAAAGMLAARSELEPGEEGLLRLTVEARDRWPSFAAELEAASGMDVWLEDKGALVVALTKDDAARLKQRLEFQKRAGLDVDWLTGTQARKLEPGLSPRAVGAVRSPLDTQVENRRVVQALEAAFVHGGGRLHEHSAVERIEIDAGRVTGVTTAQGSFEADVVVLAAGAWSRNIEGLPPEAVPPVRPVKGQMLSLRMDPAAPIITRLVWTLEAYLVPRRDGRLLVGATVEEKGFDDQLTAGGVYALLDAAWRTLPGIEDLPIDEMWVGHRPGSRDDAPILGETPVEGLVIATGHHRNGILLAPVTADAIAGLILNRTVDPLIEAFGLDRFQRPPATSPEAFR